MWARRVFVVQGHHTSWLQRASIILAESALLILTKAWPHLYNATVLCEMCRSCRLKISLRLKGRMWITLESALLCISAAKCNEHFLASGTFPSPSPKSKGQTMRPTRVVACMRLGFRPFYCILQLGSNNFGALIWQLQWHKLLYLTVFQYKGC